MSLVFRNGFQCNRVFRNMPLCKPFTCSLQRDIITIITINCGSSSLLRIIAHYCQLFDVNVKELEARNEYCDEECSGDSERVGRAA